MRRITRPTGHVGAEVKRGDAQGRGWASPVAISQLPKMTVVAGCARGLMLDLRMALAPPQASCGHTMVSRHEPACVHGTPHGAPGAMVGSSGERVQHIGSQPHSPGWCVRRPFIFTRLRTSQMSMLKPSLLTVLMMQFWTYFWRFRQCQLYFMPFASTLHVK
jgi:hypothetical protein